MAMSVELPVAYPNSSRNSANICLVCTVPSTSVDETFIIL
jgi:hypothetical protein